MLKPDREDIKELYYKIGIPTALFFLNLVLIVRTIPYFWDTIQFASLHAEYFLRTDFGTILLSDAIDSGNPPFFGMYVALLWKTIGKTLITSHLAIFPFLLIIVWSTVQLTAIFVKGRISIWFAAIILLDTTLLAQATLVSPDIPLMAFFLLSFLGILKSSTYLKLLGGMGLALISSRGQMILLAMIIYEILVHLRIHKLRSAQKIFEYLSGFMPGVFLVIFYGLYHYIIKGWVGYHPDSPWAPSFAFVDITGFFKNMLVVLWRSIDFGHIFTFIPALYFGSLYWKKDSDKKMKLLILLAITLYVFVLPQLIYRGLLAHRYFLPIYIVNGMITILGIKLTYRSRFAHRSVIALFVLLGMLSEHLWNYPRSVSQGWDAKLTYLPYNNTLDKAKAYINFLGIPYSEVGTAFPNLHSEYFTHLNSNTRKFKEKNLQDDRFILYSNIMNDFSDGELIDLFTNWDVVQGWRDGSIEMILFSRK